MNKHLLSVLGAGMLWGFTGVFTTKLTGFGMTSADVILIRCTVAALCFGGLTLIRNPKLFRLNWKDLWIFIPAGLISFLGFTMCYFHAINELGLSVASVLLYFSPSLVVLLSALLFKEKITGTKVIALLLSFAGCCLVSGITGAVTFSLKGVLFGLGSALCMGLYTVFTRFAIQRDYDTGVVNCYACTVAVIAAAGIWGVRHAVGVVIANPVSALWGVGFAVVSCFLPYLLYTYAMKGLENGKVAVFASVEPIVASLLGVFLFDETTSFPLILGITLVLSAVVLLNLPQKPKQSAE